MKNLVQTWLFNCSLNGIIEEILPFETPFPIQLGSLFVSYLEDSSQASFHDFLLELKQNGFAVASEISFVLGREHLSFSLNGFVDDIQMHLILTQNMDSFVPVLTEIIRINNKQLNEMRMLRKEKTDINVGIYEEISKLNSELLNSKRIIEKQNAELTKYNQLLKNLSERDVLTNAFNRRFFYEYCKNTLCKTPNLFPVSLISIDFNKFKYVNDHYGHEAGDDLLVGFVRIVREQIRSTGDIFRFGGDEFIILLRNTSLSDAKSTMKNIEELFERKSKIVTIAFGIVSIEPDMDMHECDIHRFLKTADDLMYAHKRQLSELY